MLKKRTAGQFRKLFSHSPPLQKGGLEGISSMWNIPMTDNMQWACRYFLTYTGVKLPLTLLNELQPDQLENRITFFRGYYDALGRLVKVQKIVYGEIEMEHRYQYDETGLLQRAEIVDIDGEVTVLEFDKNGLVK